MPLSAGESELDSFTVKLIDKKIELNTWDRCIIKSDFLTPTDSWDLTLSLEDSSQAPPFQEGDKIQICVNNKPQVTGYIEHINVRLNRSNGLIYQLSGRDILGPVVSANLDSKLKIVESMSILDLLNAVLKDFGITNIYNTDANNINIMTGINTKAVKNKTAVTTQIAFAKAVPGSNQSVELQYESEQINFFKAADRKDLKTLTLKDLKPKDAEGAYNFIDRILKRLGFRLWAMADGSGVIVDRPDFSSPAQHRLTRKRAGQENNIIEGELNINAEYQPVAILAKANSNDSDGQSVSMKVLAINEFNGLDSSGQPIQIIKDLQARNPGLKTIPLRPSLIDNRRKFSTSFIPVILYLKDDESRSISQLASFARKELSLKQKEYFVYNASCQGFSFEGRPFAVNTLVDTIDEITKVEEPLWVYSRTFTKSRDGGTVTNLVLMKPFTLELNGE